MRVEGAFKFRSERALLAVITTVLFLFVAKTVDHAPEMELWPHSNVAMSAASRETSIFASGKLSSVRLHEADVQEYQNRCVENGVPIPPPLAQWQNQVELSEEVGGYFFGATRKATLVRSYRENLDPRTKGGFCINLLRRSAPGSAPAPSMPVPAAGTICVDRAMFHACFFDSIVYREGALIQLDESETETTPFSALAHPLDYPDVCANCHRGQRPFIVHPYTRLGEFVLSHYPLDAQPIPENRNRPFFSFVPLSANPSTFAYPWVNDLPFPVAESQKHAGGAGACMACHALPDAFLNQTYQASILENALLRTMPPHQQGLAGPHIGRPRIGHDGKPCFDRSQAAFAPFFTSVIALLQNRNSNNRSAYHSQTTGAQLCDPAETD